MDEATEQEVSQVIIHLCNFVKVDFVIILILNEWTTSGFGGCLLTNTCKLSSHFFHWGNVFKLQHYHFFLYCEILPESVPILKCSPKKIHITLGTPFWYNHSKQCNVLYLKKKNMFVATLANTIYFSYPQYLPTIVANIKAGMVQSRL